MKILLVSMMFFLFTNPASEIPVQTLRTQLYDASKKSSVANEFYSMMKNADTASPLHLGYKAMAEFMKCYHSFNPVTKLSYFAKGKTDLDHAISVEPENIELRYLRFTVQTNIPFFLNYSSSMNDDKNILIKNFSSVKDEELKQMIAEFMLNSDACSAEEKSAFQNRM